MLREAVELNLCPHDLSVSQHFTLDKNSKILDYFKKMCEQPENIRNDVEINAKIDIIDITR